MKKKTKIAIIIGVIALVVIIALAAYLIILSQPKKDLTDVCFDKKCFRSEIADTLQERTIGLMFRKQLEEDKGMLFVFDDSRIWGFWMKNTYIPLDMIWISEDFKVVYIAHAIPCLNETCISYNPGKEAKYVLEVNSGMTDKYNITLGENVVLQRPYIK